MGYARTAIEHFSTTNPVYVNATVTAYTVVDGVKTATKASLYSSITGATLLANPQTLDANGKFRQPVYIQDAVILTVTGLGNTPDHDTGIIQVDEKKSLDVTISSAELLALHTTPKTLVAAPGANKALVFEHAEFFLDYNSAAYAGIAAGDDLNIRYTDGSGVIAGTLETTGFLDQTADKYALVRALTSSSLILPVNAALVGSLAGAVITGNSPLGVRVHYSVIDFSTLSAS
jgi:hypothetical protein